MLDHNHELNHDHIHDHDHDHKYASSAAAILVPPGPARHLLHLLQQVIALDPYQIDMLITAAESTVVIQIWMKFVCCRRPSLFRGRGRGRGRGHGSSGAPRPHGLPRA